MSDTDTESTIDAMVIRGVTEGLLAAKYDNPKPIPRLHDEMWELCTSSEPKVAIAAPRSHAKCVSGDTLVSMYDGTRKPIRDVSVGDRVVTAADKNKFTISRVSKKFDSGKKPCLRITTRSNRTIDVTAEHKILTFDGFQRAGDLGVGGYLASPRCLPSDTRSDKTADDVMLVAYMIAEGALSSTNCNFTNFDAGIVNAMRSLCKRMGFGFQRKKGRKGQYRLTGAVPYFREHGLYGHTALTKRLPEWVFQLPDELKWLFVSCLWDTDGWFAQQAQQAGITLANEPLIDDIRELLLQLSVVSVKRERPNDYAGAWMLRIDGQCLDTFVRSLRLIAKRRQADTLLKDSRHSLVDIYPNAIKKARVNVEREYRAARVARVDNRYEITRNKLQRMIAYEPIEEWVAAEDADVFWDRIESIEPIGEIDTYDIMVWGYGNYVGNGVVMSNSTAVTHAYILCMMLFRVKSFCLLVSDTEGQAAEFLGDIKAELLGNDALKKTFGVKKLIKDTETNVICEMKDGHKFRIVAKGSEQKVRGLKWMGKRPDLIVGDDLENDEIVLNPDRREKFRRWFMNALVPCGSDTCWIRIVGTILHLDSMLNRLLEDPTWRSLKYQAHNPDFSEILWPEQFSRERLEAIRAGYLAQNDPEGYAQEYLNCPIAIENAFFNKDYFFDFERDDGAPILPNLEYFAAADFAISESEKADYTAIVVCGVDPNGIVYVVDAKRGRWDSDRIIEELLATNKMWKPNLFTFETAKVDKAIGPFLNREMQRQRNYLNIHLETPTKSKTARAKSIQGMHKSGSIRYDRAASWYPDFEAELLTVADSGPRGKNDDFFDAFAYVGLTIDQYYEAQSPAEIEEEEYQDMYEDFHDQGRCFATGY